MLDHFIHEVKSFSKKSGEQIKQANVADNITRIIKKNKEQFNFHFHLHKLNSAVAANKRTLTSLWNNLGKKTFDLMEKGSIDTPALKKLQDDIKQVLEEKKAIEEEIESLIHPKE